MKGLWFSKRIDHCYRGAIRNREICAFVYRYCDGDVSWIRPRLVTLIKDVFRFNPTASETTLIDYVDKMRGKPFIKFYICFRRTNYGYRYSYGSPYQRSFINMFYFYGDPRELGD